MDVRHKYMALCDPIARFAARSFNAGAPENTCTSASVFVAKVKTQDGPVKNRPFEIANAKSGGSVPGSVMKMYLDCYWTRS